VAFIGLLAICALLLLPPAQIAKAQGAFVATTCSGRNADFVKGLGADRAIDYTQERWARG
jgi:NADPH:quinone reductase-like Zn-dependent oxidoreductase